MVVFSETKIKILKFLINNRNKEFSIKNLAENLKLDYKNTNLAIKDLKKEKIIDIKKLAGSLICSSNYSFTPIINYVETLRKEKFLKKREFKLLIKDLELIKIPFVCLLFGSYVKGEETKNSDIDLLFITENEKKIEKIIGRFPFDIHATYVNYEDFILMANNKEFSVVEEVLKKNIILVGIEEFYRIMKNVTK